MRPAFIVLLIAIGFGVFAAVWGSPSRMDSTQRIGLMEKANANVVRYDDRMTGDRCYIFWESGRGHHFSCVGTTVIIQK